MSENVVLSQGESVLFQSRFSVLKFLRRWVLSMLACGGSLVIAAGLGSEPSRLHLSMQTAHTLQAVFAAISVAAFLLFLFGFLLYRQQYVVLTNNRLIITSLWNLRSENVVLRNIRNIQKKRTVLGMLFGYGTLRVQDSDNEWMTLPFIPHVDRLESCVANASMHPADTLGA